MQAKSEARWLNNKFVLMQPVTSFETKTFSAAYLLGVGECTKFVRLLICGMRQHSWHLSGLNALSLPDQRTDVLSGLRLLPAVTCWARAFHCQCICKSWYSDLIHARLKTDPQKVSFNWKSLWKGCLWLYEKYLKHLHKLLQVSAVQHSEMLLHPCLLDYNAVVCFTAAKRSCCQIKSSGNYSWGSRRGVVWGDILFLQDLHSSTVINCPWRCS